MDANRNILAHALRSQIAAHAAYGGVVPEIAAREHICCIDLLSLDVLSQSGLSWSDVDAIAATSGPGLVGGLHVGATFGKALALATRKPFLGVNHLEGHALTPRLSDHTLQFPYLLLLASGGHCLLAHVKGVGRYHLYGETLDDAPGEAFDKIAILLGLSMPGGPMIEKIAAHGNPESFSLPLPLISGRRTHRRPHQELHFSFSGLKTAVRRQACKANVLGAGPENQTVANLSAALQTAVADIFVDRCTKGLQRFQLETDAAGPLAIAGGVMANRFIRARLQKVATSLGARLVTPPEPLCVDNAAMIGWAGLERLRLGERASPLQLTMRPRWPLQSLLPPVREGRG